MDTKTKVKELKSQISARVDAKMALLEGAGYLPRKERKDAAGAYDKLRGLLTQLEKDLIEVVYQPLEALSAIPVKTDFDPGAQNIVYQMGDVLGEAKTVADKSDDYPMVNTFTTDHTRKVLDGGAAYEFSVNENRSSAMLSYDIADYRAKAAATAIARWHDRMATTGSPAESAGVTGFVNDANVPVISPDTGSWGSASGIQIYNDALKLLNSISEATEGVYRPNAFGLDTASFNLLQTKRIGTENSSSVLETLQRNVPELSAPGAIFEWVTLKNKDASGTGPRIVAYRKDPMVAAYSAVTMYEEMPPEFKHFKFYVACRGRSAGTVIYQPKAVAYMDVA